MLLILSGTAVARAAEYILTSYPKATATTSTETVFVRPLSVGTSGQDVLALRKILSLELSMNLGVSALFDDGLKSAVARFQEKYPVDILLPQGKTSGTGMLDDWTLTKLNALAIKYNIHLSDFSVSTAAAPRIYFTEDLSIGSVGSEVVFLKKVLNSDPATAIVKTGSAAALENVFDADTAAAVIKFQEKYAADILTPAGLVHGTGTVGAATRKKLNEIFNKLLAAFQTTATSTSLAASSSTTFGNFTFNFTQGSGVNFNSYLCVTDTWSCSDWSPCVDGVQTRTCSVTYDCPNTGAPAPTKQLCYSQSSGSSGGNSGFAGCSADKQTAVQAAIDALKKSSTQSPATSGFTQSIFSMPGSPVKSSSAPDQIQNLVDTWKSQQSDVQSVINKLGSASTDFATKQAARDAASVLTGLSSGQGRVGSAQSISEMAQSITDSTNAVQIIVTTTTSDKQAVDDAIAKLGSLASDSSISDIIARLKQVSTNIQGELDKLQVVTDRFPRVVSAQNDEKTDIAAALGLTQGFASGASPANLIAALNKVLLDLQIEPQTIQSVPSKLTDIAAARSTRQQNVQAIITALQSAFAACQPKPNIAPGTVVASGYFEVCLANGKTNCSITSGNATCTGQNSNPVACPAGSSVVPGSQTTNNSASQCPSLGIAGPQAAGHINFTCVQGGSAGTPSTGGSSSCTDVIGCAVQGVGNIVGGVVSGVGSIVHGVLSIFGL